MSFSSADRDRLLGIEANKQLCCPPEEKYKQYACIDPFPEIGDSLLNSVDIVKYCMTTGMIDPFDITSVEGVTYTCHFSGKYYYWSGTADNPEKITEEDNAELILRPNSITYLEVKEIFRVPDYLIIRYNLNVSHVYKGLLLGTGPIVDPGFVGHLYIPLHNLTSNEYRIRKDAPLITLEFTKIGRSKHSDGTNPASQEILWPAEKQHSFDFSGIQHQSKSIRPMRTFEDYLQRALITDESFRKTTDNLCVGSAIPERIEAAETSARAAKESAKHSEKSLNQTKYFIYGLGSIGFITLLVTIAGLILSINARIDNVISNSTSMSAEIQQLEDQNVALQNQIQQCANEKEALQDIIDELVAGSEGGVQSTK